MTTKKTKSVVNYSILTMIALLCFVQSDWAASFNEYAVPTSNSGPLGITMGPDNALWFVELYGNKIGRIDSTTHVISEYVIPTANSGAGICITTGPDAALWFTEGGNGDTPDGANRIGRTPHPRRTVALPILRAGRTALSGLQSGLPAKSAESTPKHMSLPNMLLLLRTATPGALRAARTALSGLRKTLPIK
jgi:hypothetical protein